MFGWIIIIQFVEGKDWAEMGEGYIYKTDIVPANRGDILASDGRILASSVPYYSVYIDTRSTGMAPETWVNGIDGLASGLSTSIGLKSSQQWKKDLTLARQQGDRYYLLKRRVSHNKLKELQTLPIIREGRYKGGLIAESENRRILPHMKLAARTIGSLNLGGNVVGLVEAGLRRARI